MKNKRILMAVLLFMAIGIASVTTNVIFNMTTPINKKTSDFDVYFSSASQNGQVNADLITAKDQITFAADLTAIGDSEVIDYTIYNSSSSYDAKVTISCTESTDYLNISNAYDSNTNIAAKDSATGKLTISLKKSYVGDTNLTQTVTCSLDVSAVERTSLAE